MLLHRPRLFGYGILLTAALVAASPAPAQAPIAGDSTRRWQLEGALGVVSSVPPLQERRAGLIVEAQAGSGSRRALRLVVTAAYMREFGRGDVRCCGPSPGFSYTEET